MYFGDRLIEIRGVREQKGIWFCLSWKESRQRRGREDARQGSVRNRKGSAGHS